jgi:Na+/proline symporter/signal transduction histidine kinase/CheY-like chemotaxis protein
MLNGTTVFVASIGYVAFLFAVAWLGDRYGRRFVVGKRRALVYSLSLAVYCTSWTYYGSVGIASASGFDFLPIYIGPILVVGFGHRLLARISALSRAQNLTTVADFVSARYGKSQGAAALAALIALTASAPYIALQLKSITQTMLMVVESFERGRLTPGAPSAPFYLAVTLLLAAFAMAFGTRRIDPTEHQDGLILAISVESVVKLAAFLAVGAFVVWGLFGGLGALFAIGANDPRIAEVMRTPPNPANWVTTTLLSASAILLLPRQFHVSVVENRNVRDVASAAWLFPLYLVLINLFVAPLAIAGLATFGDGVIDRDLTVLALPLNAGAHVLALTTMLGGLSAATGMVVVESVALAITVSNDLVMPILLRRRAAQGEWAGAGEIGARVLNVRRLAILGVLTLGYLYAQLIGPAALSSIGLLSFAAIAQILPAFLGALIWRRGTARGAVAGMIVGLIVWFYLLLLPSLNNEGALGEFLLAGPLGLAWLRPGALTGFSAYPLVGGVALSLGANVLAFVLGSLTRQATPMERMQATAFVGAAPSGKPQAFRLWRASTTMGELEATVARYLGAARARRAFETFTQERGLEAAASDEADAHMIRHAEHLLSPAIGASTSRLVLSLLLRRRAMSGKSALKLLDDASAAFQSNRDQLQHALDHARQGITVFDNNLVLTAWNREFADLFGLPPPMLRLGVGLDEILRFNASRGAYGPGRIDDLVAERLESLLNHEEPIRLRLHPSLRVLEVRSARLPDGGIVTTYTDVTQTVQAEEELAAANERLERRVQARTADLERLNRELARAKTAAEDANLSKTRFLAAAGHDILQPLNAARLYASTLTESVAHGPPEERLALARNVDASLEAVEEILGALLDISRLDAGATRPEVVDFPMHDIFRQLDIEFAPTARAKGLTLRFVASSLSVRSDRRLMRRLLQNLVSNALKYTPKGRVLVGCRRFAGSVRIEVWDTGLGIPADQHRQVFEEFLRLEQGMRAARGLGLGLSIVERLGRVLGHPIGVHSAPGRGSVFSVVAPLGAAGAAPAAEPGAPEPLLAGDALEGLRVLAIDNEPRVLDGMRALLTKWGCRVALAHNLQEGRAALAQLDGAPDAIIADFHLDEGDGLSAIAELRQQLGYNAPAILATADRSQEVREAAARADVALLNKPVKPAPLRAQLRRCLALREAAE